MLPVFFLIMLAASFAGCAGGDGADSTIGAENTAFKPDPNPFGELGDSGDVDEDGDLEDSDNGHDDPPTSEPVDNAVSLKKSTNSLGKIVYGVEINEITLKAAGGGGKYVWSIENLPDGLVWENPDSGKKATIKGTPSQLGNFKVRVSVADQSDESKYAERELDLKVVEDIAINVYGKVADPDREGKFFWKRVTDTDSISLAPGTVLLLISFGHATKHTWAIDNYVICDDDDSDDNCSGERSGLELKGPAGSILESRPDPDGSQSDAAPPAPPKTKHRSLVYVRAQQEFFGEEFKNVKVSVRDEFNNEDSIEISSLTFEKDPCKAPLTIGNASVGFIGYFISVDVSPGKGFSIPIDVLGGKWPYDHEIIDVEEAKRTLNIEEIWTDTENGGKLTISGQMESKFSYDDVRYGKAYHLGVLVKDGCQPQRVKRVSVYIKAKYNEDLTKFTGDKFKSKLVIGANDTDTNSSLMLKLLEGDGEAVGYWKDKVKLDQYGDGNEGCTGDDTECENTVTQPEMEFTTYNIMDIAKVRFDVGASDNDNFENLDILFYSYVIDTPHWCGKAAGLPSEDQITYACIGGVGKCETSGSYEYKIEWKYKETEDVSCLQ